MSESLSEVATERLPVDPQAAQELSQKIDAALLAFATEHDALIRQACGVPLQQEKLDFVVICTFLGHTLDRLSARTGRPHTEHVVESVLNEVERERQKTREKGLLQ